MKKYRAAWALDNDGDVSNRSLFAYDTIDEALDVLKKKTRLPFGTKMWIEVTEEGKEKVVRLPVEKKLLVFKDDMDKIDRYRLDDIAGIYAFGKKKKEDRTIEVNIANCPRCDAKAINIITYTNPRWVDTFVYCECDYCRLKSKEVRVTKDQSTEEVITAAYEEWNKMAEMFN